MKIPALAGAGRARGALPGTVHLFVAASLACAGVADAAPPFPWTSLRAIAAEHPIGQLYPCDPNDGRTAITAFFVERSREFFRIWIRLRGPDWVAVHFDEEARPDWVWHGTWSGDLLRVSSVAAFDPVAHASACDLLFNTAQPEGPRNARAVP